MTLNLGAFFGIYFERNNIDLISIVTLILTGISTIATAYAALSAAKSANIAQRSALTWKSQMQLGIELTEAKQLKIALHSWYRHYLIESERYLNENLKRVCELTKLEKNISQKNQLDHLEKYSTKLTELWNELESSFDNAGFISANFDDRLQLRRSFLIHKKGCENLISYTKGYIDESANLLELSCSAVYQTSDWHAYALDDSNLPVTRIAWTTKQNGKKAAMDDENNNITIYESVYDSINGWITDIGVTIDNQILLIKDKLGHE